MSMRGRGHKRSQGPSGQGDTGEEQDVNRKRARMQLRFPMYFQHFRGGFYGMFPTFTTYGILLPIRLELWVFKGLFGLDHELIPLFENTYSVSINVKQEEDDMLLYINGLRINRAFTLILIVSLACKLRMKRN